MDGSRLVVSFSLSGITPLMVIGAAIVGMKCATEMFSAYMTTKKEIHMSERPVSQRENYVMSICEGCKRVSQGKASSSDMEFSVVEG